MGEWKDGRWIGTGWPKTTAPAVVIAAPVEATPAPRAPTPRPKVECVEPEFVECHRCGQFNDPLLVVVSAAGNPVCRSATACRERRNKGTA